MNKWFKHFLLNSLDFIISWRCSLLYRIGMWMEWWLPTRRRVSWVDDGGGGDSARDGDDGVGGGGDGGDEAEDEEYIKL